ncbi:hypothetical protein SDC9_120233 [bioreactor metagenome]|uniref:Uncharacterized protein n=1 Tax=bioreactor metagenome TaxID=1076179 RepID=A0A645C7R7_9ZZZZ
MDDILCPFPLANHKIFFIGCRAHAGKIGDRVADVQRGIRLSLRIKHKSNILRCCRKILFLIGFNRIGPNQRIVVDGFDQSAAFRVALFGGRSAKGGNDGMHAFGCLVVENRICALSGVNGEEAVLRHFCNVFRENTRCVDYDLGIDRPAVGTNGRDCSIHNRHIQHGGVQ